MVLPLFFGVHGVAWGQTFHQIPKGIAAGSFYLFPALEFAYEQNDNIYAMPSGEVKDEIEITKAGLGLVSNWSNHFLMIQGNAEMGKYSRQNDEDYLDYTATASGRLDILRGVNVSAGLGVKRRHEERGSANDLYGSEPAKYNLISGDFSFAHEVSVLRLNANLKSDNYQYDNTPTSALIDMDQAGRNRTQIEGTLRLALVALDLNSFFVQGRYFGRDYEFRDKAKYGYDRNSTGYEFTVGYKRVISGISVFEIQFGNRGQEYVDEDLQDIKGFQAVGSFKWTPSPLTSVTIYVNRSIEESIMENVSGYFATNYGISIDKEFSSSLLLKAGFVSNDLDYQGVERQDKMHTYDVGLFLFMTEYVYMGVSYNYKNRESSDTGMNYHASVSKVTLVGRI
ncbi:MAG: outer membrane beta-barrel protein [Nitrospinota bacterium]|nr:outer membrane beta-barrel protein [Nitrospinota bacterium]